MFCLLADSGGFWVYIWGGGSKVAIIAAKGEGALTYIATVNHP